MRQLNKLTSLKGSYTSRQAIQPLGCVWLHTCHSLRAPKRAVFVLDGLPSFMREQFDFEANQRALSHLMNPSRNEHSCNSLTRQGTDCTSSPSPRIVVHPNWAHVVSWRCTVCHYGWSARPCDRLDPQSMSSSGCPQCRIRASSATSSSVHGHDANDTAGLCTVPRTCASAGTLLTMYPRLAAQWDHTRNSILQNKVWPALEEVTCSSSMKVWWNCLFCKRPWLESVSGRVTRYQQMQSSGAGDAVALCPSCESRGCAGSANDCDSGNAMCSPRITKHYLADDVLLMDEAQLRPHENPAELSLMSETVLNWRCRYCCHEYQASVANRYLRYERCPQCTGRTRSPHNLLVIQRPDVVREVSVTVSRTYLSKLTVHAEDELTFVCRLCLSPYRMAVRTRCSVEIGSTACPKCFWVQCNTVKLAVNQSMVKGQESKLLSRRERKKIERHARRLCKASQSAERLAITRAELKRRDILLKN